MNFLLKYPTRGRRDLFQTQFNRWNGTLSGLHSVSWVISCDNDDHAMADLKSSPGCLVFFNQPNGKVAACNANMKEALLAYPETEVVVLVSDDMVPMVRGWDNEIATLIYRHYPSLDGAIHLNDGLQGLRLATLSVMGISLYREFGYFYHPDYLSTYCDKEYTDLIWSNRKVIWYPEIIIEHQWIGDSAPDELHQFNHSLMTRDSQVYKRRRELCFPRNSVMDQLSC